MKYPVGAIFYLETMGIIPGRVVSESEITERTAELREQGLITYQFSSVSEGRVPVLLDRHPNFEDIPRYIMIDSTVLDGDCSIGKKVFVKIMGLMGGNVVSEDDIRKNLYNIPIPDYRVPFRFDTPDESDHYALVCEKALKKIEEQ